ncbi:transcription repressor OFP8-like [Cornus florida]|uniref:transcription repressor OFP8-like n=1 Tax=Cornus florida TaxID=4283 RepID=UPI002896484F|nr:transcription repressor OFP8-like [Cornus florida]
MDCNNTEETGTSTAFLYSCNGKKKSCPAFLICSDDNDETTLFSSKSLSSDSSGRSFYQNRPRCDRQIETSRRRSNQRKDSEMGLMPVLQGKVEDSFAAVKCSSDPYNDFRTSMVEMIVEREIFGAKDLENLLQCFLSLNSCHHHRVIVEVLTEIWGALFSNSSY